ncbi:type IV toxin-antitoxin system AbiEi family antitoxin [Halalkalibaculum sp. DA384]|uniref:type IV toxin-antitoxin system AbiEi family antitoxin domain-containing protein n=1 Tax=Halalkalibaculum sp. DA384 TaxID=3373606 RepID=UPI0037544C15
MANNHYEYLDSFLDRQRSRGRFTFTADEVKKEFELSENAFKKTTQRLLEQNKISRLRNKFYLIIPPEYSTRQTLPLGYFIDDLMTFLDREYYVGLLTAAMYHGAAHQQPQQQFVVHDSSYIRPIDNRRQSIVFCLKKEWNKKDIQEQKTDAGFINISSPELTAFDLLFYVDRIGGFNRAATVLSELQSNIESSDLFKAAQRFNQTTTLQRLGYIIDEVLSKAELADAIYQALDERTFYPTKLSTSEESDNQRAPNRWKVIPNIEIEAEL